MAAPRKPTAEPGTDAALLEALARVRAPAARLAVARGLPFAAVEELFKRAFIRAARDSAAVDGAVPTVSAIATASGLTRREVTRLAQEEPAPAAERPSLATQVFTSWRGERSLRSRDGTSKPLPRTGPPPSFEALAQSVTRDVHPRTLLDELCRLGLARVDEATDSVHLLHNAFVPRDDLARLMKFLGANVGDHLAASVANVIDKPNTHFEQAVFADGLSEDSIEAARKLVSAQWRALMAAIVPELEALIEADRKALERNRTHRAKRRLRVGLYSFNEDMPLLKETKK
jgi:Family of unknown function (DUF6502)